MNHHHQDIDTSAKPIRPQVRDDDLVKQDLTVAFLHGSNDVREDLFALCVWPVV